MAPEGSGTLSRVPITVPGSTGQNMLCISSTTAAMGSLSLEPSFQVVHAILHYHRKHELGAARINPGRFLKNLSHQTRLPTVRMLSTPTCRLALFLRRSHLATNSTTLTSLLVENTVDTLIDFLNTQTFVEHQIKDSREHAHSCHLSCLSCANFQRDCNFTDCHPSFPVDPFDHHTTSTFYHFL